MNKTRADSIWAGLPPAQRETLEGWLFDENLAYREVQERAEKEFGVKGSVASIAAYYRKMNEKRRLQQLTESKVAAEKITEPEPGDPNLGEATVKLLELSAYELAMAGPERLKLNELSWLMKTLLADRRQKLREKEAQIAEAKMHAEEIVRMSKYISKQANEPRGYTRAELKDALQFIRKEFFNEDEYGRKLKPTPAAAADGSQGAQSESVAK